MGIPVGPINLLTFDESLQLAGENPHLLLGNGFSRACREDIFAYNALFDRADFGHLPQTAREAFNALQTTDFEVVMRALRTAESLIRVYLPVDRELAARLAADADGIRNVLASAIAQNHPERPGDLAADRYQACRGFLSHFSGIYTLNYDLLLYWALMQSELPPEIGFDDGFRTPDEGEAQYVTWDVEKTQKQNLFYLHGALHLYDAGPQLQKYTWNNTRIALIEQIRDALAQHFYPLIVAEGTSDEKMDRIQHSNYLGRGYRSFAAIGGSLFVYGHGMGDNDDHWYRLIQRGKIRKLFVGLYGDPQTPNNLNLIAKATRLPDGRPRRSPLEVTFFDSESAQVWG